MKLETESEAGLYADNLQSGAHPVTCRVNGAGNRTVQLLLACTASDQQSTMDP